MYILIQLADIDASEITGDAVQVFVNFFLAIGMFVVLFLPLLLIPYIFIKLGGMAGKVQAKVNSLGRQGTRAATKRGKEAYRDSGFGQARQLRKDARKAERKKRTLEGHGLGGALFNAEGQINSRIPRTAGQKAGDLRMQEALEATRRKAAEERIDNVHRNLSGNVVTALSEGVRPQDLRAAQKYDSTTGSYVPRFSSAEDLASLEYLDRTGLSQQPDAALATAAMRKLYDIENIPGDSEVAGVDGRTKVAVGPEIAVQNLASMVGGDVEANKRFSEEVSSGASKHGYKNLAYGNVTNGVFTNYTEAGKTPKALVDGGLKGINKDMLDDANIQNALRNKVAAEGRTAQLQIIQQTMHIDKDGSLKTLSDQIGVDIDTLKAVRQSIQSNGTINMPPGW